MSAGLPYRTFGNFRCWGRDTMISLRGLLLIPKRYKEARMLLLVFASLMRHGLIPDSFDQSKKLRYNARDVTWFFMETLQEYVKFDTEYGPTIFSEKVEMQFLDSNQEEHFKKISAGNKKVMTFEEIIQEIMQAHANGIDFTEWDAGEKINYNMNESGFHIQIKLNPENGCIYGGNSWNCGTWMDKIGKYGNRDPATSRDGADVEIIGLLRSSLRFLDAANQKGIFSYDSVIVNSNNQEPLTYKKWVSTQLKTIIG